MVGRFVFSISSTRRAAPGHHVVAKYLNSTASTGRTRPIVSIHSTPERPSATYAAVSYHGVWYWVDDHDYNAKRAFTFLMLFFSLAETGVITTPPVLTIPAS